MKLFQGPPTETEEFFHQKKMDNLKFNFRKIAYFSIFAFILVSVIMYANKDKYPPGEMEKSLLVGAAGIIFLLVFVSWYSVFLQKFSAWLWQLRKNQK